MEPGALRDRRFCTTIRVTLIRALVLIPKTLSTSSSVISDMGLSQPRPALLTRRSMGPRLVRAVEVAFQSLKSKGMIWIDGTSCFRVATRSH